MLYIGIIDQREKNNLKWFVLVCCFKIPGFYSRAFFMNKKRFQAQAITVHTISSYILTFIHLYYDYNYIYFVTNTYD